jgi:uncharacterized protein (DUF488 family)
MGVSLSSRQVRRRYVCGQAKRAVVTRSATPGLFSIGHSNVDLARLVDLLDAFGIDVVADVRSFPRSSFVPHFNGESLRLTLAEHGIQYVFLGRELGGRPEGDHFYDDDDYVLYGQVAEADFFQAGLERLLRGAKEFRVAVLCSEENPATCHRHLLIGRVLRDRGFEMNHIRHDGSLRTEDDLTRDSAPCVQEALFGAAREREWKSLQSVSRKRAPSASSSSLAKPRWEH